MNRLIHLTVGTALDMRRRGERGLSQSTENAILLAGAVAIAAAIILAVKTFVDGQMAKLHA